MNNKRNFQNCCIPGAREEKTKMTVDATKCCRVGTCIGFEFVEKDAQRGIRRLTVDAG